MSDATNKYTPGPWFVDTCSIYARCQMDEEGMSDEMPILEGGTGRDDDLLGNLALAAAAPELLDVLEGLISSVRSREEYEGAGTVDLLCCGDDITRAWDAIAKAKGTAS